MPEQIGISESDLTIKSKKAGEFKVKIKMPGLYNAYNALAAISAAIELNLPVKSIISGLENYNTVFGRAELTHLKGRPVLIQLIKNPVGLPRY